MRIRRKRAALAACCALTLLFSACSRAPEPPRETRVTASFYPVYALTAQLLAGVPDVRVDMLVQPQDGCPRDYQLSEWDLGKLATTSVVVLAGRGLESFESVTEALEPGPAILEGLAGMPLIGEEQDAPADDEGADRHFIGGNPWAWLSPTGAAQLCEGIEGGLSELFPEQEDKLHANLDAIQLRLSELQKRMDDLRAAYDGRALAILHEGLFYVARDVGQDSPVPLYREPGQAVVGEDLTDMLAALETSGARVALLEKQAPLELKTALAQRGITVIWIDTMVTHAADGGQGFFDALAANADALERGLAGR